MKSFFSPIQLVKGYFQKKAWALSTTLTESERQILNLFLNQDDSRCRKFWSQWQSAQEFQRAFTNSQQNQYDLRWRRSKVLLSHNSLRKRLESEPLVVTDQLSGKDLRFKLTVQAGGWSGPLIGETIDGSPFPLEWKLKPSIGEMNNRDLLPLPIMADQDAGKNRFTSWLNSIQIDSKYKDYIEFFEPATASDLDQMQQRLQIELPDPYLQLLRVSNGLLIGECYIPGTSDCPLTPFPDDSHPASLFLADDIINNLSDGFYCLQLE
ncbi:hypothetical protein, partial [uncultured Gimesia sp.]|uniref:hypothetical protein n=1 Tax=uncultured Gimesia sp. TaxID=1678688 RepID=UPI002606B09D